MCCISVHLTTAQMFPSTTILVLDRLFNEGFFSIKQLVMRKTYSSSHFIFSSTLSLTNSFTQIPSPPSLYKHSTSPPSTPRSRSLTQINAWAYLTGLCSLLQSRPSQTKPQTSWYPRRENPGILLVDQLSAGTASTNQSVGIGASISISRLTVRDRGRSLSASEPSL